MHKIHIEQGNEYWGEIYIWCECLAPGETVFSSSYRKPDHADAVFQGETLGELTAWLGVHDVPA
jgi:hypothetical protein